MRHHWKERKKIEACVEWSCRMCSNGGRRFPGGWEDALRHAELHLAGLIVHDNGEEAEDTDSTSGGFSSGHDCVSSEEDESDLSSVSERETEHGSDNMEADDDGNEN